ncbi:RagB/SusD family nutrient uptake outer membrane protein [Pedobacter sp. ASV28]|jgi:starch-binding outer membrane protein, SusD/RagB family|uniref:RagB/SusD family nutrient uptake outer membrane protein n=1 Tax=Pedobacter sp. ASV28 TaxID=2795123 RepID=UPI0018ED9F89|nr:RagB/SusD family nutrient uptake outer membrane protein [Pedobacter sp. ASV28]
MKTISQLFIKGLIFLLCLSAFAGCKKFLDAPPLNVVTKAEALKDEAGVAAVMNSAYQILGGGNVFGGRYQVISELMADQIQGNLLSGDFGEIYGRKTSVFGDYKNNFYTEIYQANFRANTVLENLEVTAAKRDDLEGQARFVRAFAHFISVRLFAQPYGYSANNDHLGVPLRISTAKDAGVRATVKQVYDLIISDLKIAENKMNDVNPGYPTKWAAKALLAKVYFSMNDFANAYNYANQVISSGKFTFETDYSKRFSEGQSTEAIFQIVNTVGSYDTGGELRGQFRSDFNLPTLRFTAAVYSAVNTPNDIRKAWFNIVKYPGEIPTTKYNKERFNVSVIHLTDMKLIRAESAAERNENLNVAIGDINDILNRAYAGTKSIPVGSSALLVKTNARFERAIEMVAEGDRLYEIKRIGARGENIDKRGAAWNCNGLVLQFPQGEISSNTSFVRNPEGGCN